MMITKKKQFSLESNKSNNDASKWNENVIRPYCRFRYVHKITRKAFLKTKSLGVYLSRTDALAQTDVLLLRYL